MKWYNEPLEHKNNRTTPITIISEVSHNRSNNNVCIIGSTFFHVPLSQATWPCFNIFSFGRTRTTSSFPSCIYKCTHPTFLSFPFCSGNCVCNCTHNTHLTPALHASNSVPNRLLHFGAGQTTKKTKTLFVLYDQNFICLHEYHIVVTWIREFWWTIVVLTWLLQPWNWNSCSSKQIFSAVLLAIPPNSGELNL